MSKPCYCYKRQKREENLNRHKIIAVSPKHPMACCGFVVVVVSQFYGREPVYHVITVLLSVLLLWGFLAMSCCALIDRYAQGGSPKGLFMGQEETHSYQILSLPPLDNDGPSVNRRGKRRLDTSLCEVQTARRFTGGVAAAEPVWCLFSILGLRLMANECRRIKFT